MIKTGLVDRLKGVLVILIIFAGFLLRFYGAARIPLTYDEAEKVIFIQEISFSKNHVNLPLGSKLTFHPPLVPYMMKLSMYLFGESLLALRLPAVILGTLMLWLLYDLLKNNINTDMALLALCLTSFSKFFIGAQRIMWEAGLLLFFTTLVLWLIQKLFQTNKKHYLFLIAIAFGLGALVKMSFVTLLPVVAYYIFIYKGWGKNLFNRDMVIFVAVFLIVLSPTLIWNFMNEGADFDYQKNRIDFLTVSLGPTVLFLGDIFVYCLSGINDKVLSVMTSMEYPFMDWYLGLLCLGGVVYACWSFNQKKKNDFMFLLLLIFLSHFIFFSVFRPRTGGGYFFHFDNFWWSIIIAIPGIILGCHMLVDRFRRAPWFSLFLGVGIVLLGINACLFVQFPANCFLPRKSLQLTTLQSAAETYLQMGEKKRATRIYKYIEKHYPEDQ